MASLPVRAKRTPGYNLNPVKFSRNCFLAALLMEITRTSLCLWFGEKLFVGGNMLGWGVIELGGYFLISFVHLEQ